ncbi:MAG: hypothetical protein QOE06_132 [Thermoleophilaceae bacterium]|nr:hypothetical protein [Thermoleophilaceae bacterium]
MLTLTLGAFLVARADVERDAQDDSAHRAEIAATEIRGRLDEGAALLESLREFMSGHESRGVTNDQFVSIGARWLSPSGLPAAAWAQRVPGSHRLRAALVTRVAPMTVPGLDLGAVPGVAAAATRPRTRDRPTATALERLRDGTVGLFIVQAAERRTGRHFDPGFVVLFVPDSWLLDAARDAGQPDRGLELRIGATSSGEIGGGLSSASSSMALGQRFEAVVPREPVGGAAALLPWIAAAAGLVVAALVMALSLGSARRRADLTASRARIVTSTDEARRRIERDLHDGIQQRLVTLGLELQGVKEAVPAEPRSVPAQIAHLEDGMRRVLDELREISRGVHPAILSEGGLGPALRSLARRAPVPVELDVGNVERLPQQVEVAAYYAVSEALANAAKHANASVVQVNLKMHGRTLRLSIRDDGAGGADPARGSGIVGLTDRVEALGGRLAVTSPPGGGTEITVDLPAAPGRAALQPD